jgi:4-diphosphocytidyl-2-C-methyl-D-erythritol kinase
MEELKIKAPAKINLHLEVLRKRDDGFHDISSIFTLIDLYDNLIFKRSDNNISLREQNPIKDNIVLRAAELVKDLYSVKEGVSIELIKSIPDQKGLGGGSSDAAATIIGLNKLWNLKISHKELLNIALKLGSDVPFFVYGKTAWAQGRGEILEEFPYKNRFFLLKFPDLKISTKLAFEKSNLAFKGSLNRKIPDIENSFNSFEQWIRESYSEMEKAFKDLEALGKPRLSGTGSTIFMEYDNLEAAKSAQNKFPELVLTKSLERSPLMQIIE